MKLTPSKGPWTAKIAEESKEPTVWEAGIEAEGYSTFAYTYGSREEATADAEFIVAACNAAWKINPDNSLAAAEAMPEIFRLLNDAVNDASKISHGKLDP